MLETLQIGTTELPLRLVTYFEGTSFIQRALMRFSGMGGMVGNKLFIDHSIVIDFKNKEFGYVSDSLQPSDTLYYNGILMTKLLF